MTKPHSPHRQNTQLQMHHHMGIVQLPPDIEHPVVALTEGTQKALAALYNLHTALAHTSVPCTPLLAQFKLSRDAFRRECALMDSLLRHCYAHAEDYARLCKFTLTRPEPECLAFAARIAPSTRAIIRELAELRDVHDRACKALHKIKSKLKSALTQTLPLPQPKDKAKNRDKRSASVDAPPYPSPYQQQHPRPARSPCRPDGPLALSASYAALASITAALADMHAFWAAHAAHLDAIIARRTPHPFPPPPLEAHGLIASWSAYARVVVGAVSAIGRGVGAISVDPVGVREKNVGSRRRIGSPIPLEAGAPVPTKRRSGPRERTDSWWSKALGAMGLRFLVPRKQVS